MKSLQDEGDTSDTSETPCDSRGKFTDGSERNKSRAGRRLFS